MITRTITERGGEWFTDGTPAEWFAVHLTSANHRDGHRDLTPTQQAYVRALSTTPPDGTFWLVQTDGGYWHRLVTVGLYDGWPFWRKRVCIGTDGPISGLHTHEGYNIEGVTLGEPNPNPSAIRSWRFVRDSE